MSNLVIGFVSALLATNQPAAISNLVAQKTGIAIKVEASDPASRELRKIMEADDEAHDEVDLWIQEESKFAQKGGGNSKLLNERIQKRLDVVRKQYDAFIEKYPTHTEGRLAYGSFLDGMGDEHGAFLQWEKAREISPNNPATWNNIANYFGHRGPVKKAFEYYAKAIELNPNEPVYYQNFGTSVFLFRKDAREYYQIDEQQVFDKALDLYAKAQKLSPNDFHLATDIARTYYGIKPHRTEAALGAWKLAQQLARDDLEREGVYIHLARFEMYDGKYDKARAHLQKITRKEYDELKKRVGDAIDRKEMGITTDDLESIKPPGVL